MSLIEREKLNDHLNACIAESEGKTPITDAVLVAIKCAVEQMPEVDAVPVVHGKWIWTERGDEDFEQYWVCSKCGQQQYVETNYCPNCGAKMDGERRADNEKIAT